MKCKQGDMAVLNVGKQAGTVVTCLELIHRDPRLPTKTDLWRTDIPIRWIYEQMDGQKKIIECYCASDQNLTPINPDSKSIQATRMDKEFEVEEK